MLLLEVGRPVYGVLMTSRRFLAMLASLLVAGVALGVAIALVGGGGRAGRGGVGEPTLARSPAQAGWPFHRKVPSLTLRASTGQSISLADLKGKVIVLAPSLTLCHEVCPMTTQAFITMRAALAREGLGGRVAFVEATVDPWRDTPARLRAYAKLTGARFPQLTGGVSQMRRFWKWFGIGFKRVPQGHPPDVDWMTHRPETFDVEHTDGVFLIDARGYERAFFPGIADVGGHMEPALRRLLSKTGLSNLVHPGDAWTEAQVMEGVARLLGRSPARSASGA